MAKKNKPPKPKKQSGESSKEFKARKKAWKQEQALIGKYRKAGIDDPEFFAQQRGERPAPPPPHERPIPETKSREEGGQRRDGTYTRRSTVDLSKIEAHLDTKMDKGHSESLHTRFKSEFGEDLDTPEGYDLIPDREVQVRPGPPTLTGVESGLSDQVLADVYGVQATSYAPAPAPVPEPTPAPQVVEPEPAPEMEIEPEPVPEPMPEPIPEPEPEPEVEVEPEPEPEPVPEPVPEPEPEPTPPPVVLPEPGAVAGVAGAGAGATAAAEAAEPAVLEEIDPPKYKFLDLRRFIKLGRRAWITGGGIAKLVVGIINTLLYIVLIFPIPPIIIVPVAATIVYYNNERKEKKAQEEAEWDAHVAEHGYPEQGGYGQAYGGEQGEYPAEGGYYEGEGHYEEDRYGY